MTPEVLAGLLAVVAIVWTVLPLLRHDAWWVRAFEFPRVQVAAATAMVLSLYVALAGWQELRDQLLLAALAVCVVFQAARIAPYTPFYPKQVQPCADAAPDDTLSLLVANVLTPNRNAGALLEMIRGCRPDLVLAVETDRWWEAQLDALEPDYGYSVKYPLDNLYGMHLYSRLELVDPEVAFLVQDDVPSIHADVALRSGHLVRLHCLHPAPPSPTENPTSAERDAELLVVAKTLDARTSSVVVMGDLNDVAWSATSRLFQRLSGLLDVRIGRGTFNTFHARYPFARWPLDHVFCSRDFTLKSLARLDYFGSDHFPIHAVLVHTPGARAVHETLRAHAGEKAWAEEKIDKGGADEAPLRERP